MDIGKIEYDEVETPPRFKSPPLPDVGGYLIERLRYMLPTLGVADHFWLVDDSST